MYCHIVDVKNNLHLKDGNVSRETYALCFFV